MSEESEYGKSYKDEAKDIILPEWLTDEFPEHLPHMVIAYGNGMFHTSSGSTFPTIIAAYDYVSSLKNEYQVVFDKSVDGHGGRLRLNGFFCDSDARGFKRLLISITTEELETIVKHDYFTWLTEISVEYNADPDDFVKAHTWLSHHPIFWSKGSKEKSFHWATDCGLDKMGLNVWADKEKGKPVVFLEHGAHVEDGYTSFYYDDRIFVKEETFEGAIVTMARKVNEVFELDGNERA